MKLNHALLAVLAVPIATCLTPTSASASIFDSIGKAVKKVEKDVGHAAKDVGKAVKKVEKGVGKAAGDVADGVDSAAKGAAKAASKAGGAVIKAAPGVINATGTVASIAYDTAGDAVGHVPGLKETYKPLAKWQSKCFGSKVGKIGGTVGAGAAVLTGGVSSLALQAGSAASTGCAGESAIEGGKKAYKDAAQTIKKDWRDIKNSANQRSIR